MRKVVHDLAGKITEAILPITLNHKNYVDILDAMCVVMAKTITSSPGAGSEEKLVELVYVITKKAVTDMKAIDEEGDVPLEHSIANFSKFAKPDEPITNQQNNKQ